MHKGDEHENDGVFQVKAGIVTIPRERDAYLYPLVDVLKKSGCEVTLFVDHERRGHAWNLKRTLEAMLDDAENGEPVLVTMDDVITSPAWIDDWSHIHSIANTRLYSLFTRRPHLRKYEDKGYYKGIVKRGFYDVASIYIDQHGLTRKIHNWLQGDGGRLIPERRRRHYDVCIQDYFVHHGIEWTTTVPCLFEHIGDVSTMGHNVGRALSYKYKD